MIPKMIEVENFLSFGPKQTIHFNDGEPLWVLSGPNGVGKSAIFDAVSYALYGQHRGGKDGAKHLVRHGENGFHVSVQFEFAGIDYRVTRNRARNGTTQRADVYKDGEWKRVDGINTARDLENWVESLLGVNFKGFTSSILLRQGDADRILTSPGPERLAILRSILGVERYEQLGRRVREATKLAKAELERHIADRDKIVPVTEADLTSAEQSSAAAEKAWQLASQAATLAATSVPLAKRWCDLNAQRLDLEDFFAQADRDAMDAESVRTQCDRLRELTELVPRLREFLAARDAHRVAEQTLERLRAESQNASDKTMSLSMKVQESQKMVDLARSEVETHERAERQVRDEIESLAKHLKLAESLAGDDARLKEFPPNLAAELVLATLRMTELDDAWKSSGQEQAKFTALLTEAKTRQTEFESVEVGARCSRCGNPVTAEHAERERADLARLITELEGKQRGACEDESQARNLLFAAKAYLEDLHQRETSRKNLQESCDRAQAMLRQLGVTADPAELRNSLAEKQLAAERHAQQGERAAIDGKSATESLARLKVELAEATATASTATNALSRAEQHFAVSYSKLESATSQIPTLWKDQVQSITSESVTSLDQELQELDRSGVAARLKRIEDAAVLRCEKEAQRWHVLAQIAEIPEESRVSEIEAKERADSAHAHVVSADRARTAARQALASLQHRAEECLRLIAAIAETETTHRRLSKLDVLLGKDGLQRDIVREAEAEIVRLANDTARNLSNHDLSLELAPEQDGESALTLRVRRASDPSHEPTPVEFLSGSQKFRVAVSVALGIGRFAGGQARPLESVIIDEGFGSLDRDGLAAAHDELIRLKSQLKRIVLVSHQEEFAGRFSVGYRLTPGQTGTTATAFRV